MELVILASVVMIFVAPEPSVSHLWALTALIWTWIWLSNLESRLRSLKKKKIL